MSAALDFLKSTEFNLDPAVEPARVGCDVVRWQGETTRRAHAREAESGHKQSLRTVCA